MKNGAPIHTLTMITAARAQITSPSQKTGPTPNVLSSQFSAPNEGSNSQSQARTLMAGGMTQGISSAARHLRWALAGRFCRRWAMTKPIKALTMTKLTANRTELYTTIQKVGFLKTKNEKLASPTKLTMGLSSIARRTE